MIKKLFCDIYDTLYVSCKNKKHNEDTSPYLLGRAHILYTQGNGVGFYISRACLPKVWKKYAQK